jgi:hypothetical protein
MKPVVLRVEYTLRDKVMGGHFQEWTDATVRTELGEICVRVPGYHAERGSYPVLIEVALRNQWKQFCEAEDGGPGRRL